MQHNVYRSTAQKLKQASGTLSSSHHRSPPQHGCAAFLGGARRLGWAPGSYQDALLNGVASPVGQDTSDVVVPIRNRCRRLRQRDQHRGQASSLSLTLRSVKHVDEGRQVVRPRRMHCFAPSAAPRPHSPHYLTAMEGRCLNCLSSCHKRADRRLPTRCFNCHGLRHHLRDCKLP
jgi:hypothetical protein